VSESVVYRTAGMIRPDLADVGLHDPETALEADRGDDVECSMVKVWCSEVLDWIVRRERPDLRGSGYVRTTPPSASARRPGQPDL